MNPDQKLTADEIKAGLSPNWSVHGNAIEAKFVFSDFGEAWEFMSRVAEAAEAANHHPDWCNVYNKVTIKLSTHEAGGVTRQDIDLAQAIDQLYR